MRVIFEFLGGPLDGKTVVGDEGSSTEAARYYVLTNHGTIGQRFRLASDYAIDILAREQLKTETPHHFHRHYYEVFDRFESGNEVLVRARYVAAQSDHGADEE